MTTTRAYTIEDLTAGAMYPRLVSTVIASDAAAAASEVVGAGAKLMRMRWIDSKSRDHLVAVVTERDGRVWTLRAMRLVA